MKYILHLITAACFLIAMPSSFAQGKKLEKANNNFDNYAFIDARKAYLEVAEDGFLSEELLMRLGDSYYFTADYVNAAKWYGSLYDFTDQPKPEYLFRYAQALKSSGQYKASDKIMEKFNTLSNVDKRASLFVNERNYLKEIEAQSGRFKLLPVTFNSKLSDFAPAFYAGSLVFASNRLEGRNTPNRIHEWNNQPFLDIYQLPLDNSEDKDVKKLNSKVNTKYHESTAVFTRNGQTMYFTRNNFTNKKYKEDTDGTNRLKMYKGVINEDGEWKITEIPFNSDEYSVAHPALSKDEKTLYFASDMPGGKGMSDLYKVSIEGDGFGTPVSLGDKINTEFRETFPFVSQDNKLYFASDGHPGLGGLDVFVTELNEEGTGEVFNIGRPVNSLKDDFTFIVNDASGIGYFASNRDGGMGDDDIYSFEKVEDVISACTQTVSGVVVDKNTREPIPNAKVVLMDPANQIIDQLIAGKDGSFTFPLDCNKAYCVRGSKLNYGFDEECFTSTAELELELNLSLELESLNAPKIGDDLNFLLDLLPIYFDLDKDFIRADAQLELQKVISFMKMYPKVKIDVRSHTDSRAPDVYNMDLSSRRNFNTIEYIVTRGGIDRSRLTGRGYGETRLTNHCSNGVQCDEGLHQLNRRSEFIIVE
ncbi:OmpA family protein [Patiriisocius marinus]|uniref:Cell envelope biogenesis protein OmpA n=1 Tax=Patiriisocius marinus TaxID=1397112 RepID=A0A5J4J971_9FLAO|nr:OmpA family protein [Patiriisocius marinus]GER61057.1 cell envelope biogenesis protein OmpA [Patiriisocius marinus]